MIKPLQTLDSNIPRKQKLQDDSRSHIKEIRNKLKIIFQFYASFGERMNVDQLKSNKFHKIIFDANIMDHNLTKNRIDLFFVKENKHQSNMNFETFLNLLSKLALFKFPNISETQALYKLLDNHLFPLYENIMNETDLGEEETKFRQPIDFHTISLLKLVQEILQKIYVVYFKWEPHNSQTSKETKQRSQDSLFVFLKDFEICPNIITKSTAFLLYNYILETPFEDLSQNKNLPNVIPFMQEDVGKVFTMARFFVYLIRCAYVGDDNYNLTNVEQFYRLLEKMELSPGFQNIQKKTFLTNNSSTSLLVPKYVVNQIMENKQIENWRIDHSQSIHQHNQSISAAKFNVSDQKSKINENIEQSKMMLYGLYEESEMVFDKYRENLQKIFQYYCALGEPMNTTTLKSIKFKKMLKECQLLITDSPQEPTMNKRFFQDCIEIDMIFTKLTGSNAQKNAKSKGKFEFDQFLKALEIIAQRLFPDQELDTGLEYIIENHILKIIEDQNYILNIEERSSIGSVLIQQLMEILQDDELVDILGNCHKPIISFYNYYADSKQMLQFNGFFKFAKDFGIFPEILPKAKLLRIFQTLASIQKVDNLQQQQNHNQSIMSRNTNVCNRPNISIYKYETNEVEQSIDQHLFMEALALCSVQIQYSDEKITNLEKILYFMERINQSQGPSIIQKNLGHTRSLNGQSWDILCNVRKMYPQIFFNQNQFKKKQSVNCFNDILKQDI